MDFIRNNKQPIIIVLAILLIFFLYDSDVFTIQQSRNKYQQALEFQNNEDYRTAYRTYKQISSKYKAYDAVLFRQSQCAASLGDEKTVITKLKKLLTQFANSPLAPQASYATGQAYMRIGAYEKAEKAFNNTIKVYPDTDYSTGSLYYLGSIESKKDKNKSLEYWNDYLSKTSEGRFSMECVEGIKSLGIKLNESHNYNISKALYFAKRYSEALSYLEKTSPSLGWFYKGKVYLNQGNTGKAVEFFRNGIVNYKTKVSAAELKEAMELYAKYNLKPEKDNWSDLISIAGSQKDFVLYNKAKLIPPNYAQSLYSEIANKFPDGDFASEPLWNLFWYNFNSGNYTKAAKYGKLHISKYENKEASPKIIFWMGKLAERVSQPDNAKKYYNQIMSQYPDSYYAYRAYGRLKALDYDKDPNWYTDYSLYIDDTKYSQDKPYSYQEMESKAGALIAEMVEVEDYDIIANLKNIDSFVQSWIELKQGNRSRSAVLARNSMKELYPKPDTKDPRWKLIYPIFYSESVNNYSKINGLDPVMVISLMREESFFNSNAVSSSNALGLMQLLPRTARDTARWKGLGSVNEQMLFNPETNIRFGTAYLAHIKEGLGNRMLFAVAGYNGGPGAIQRWLNNNQHNDMDQFIENIPYDQTRDYVKKVYGSYWNYRRIYGF